MSPTEPIGTVTTRSTYPAPQRPHEWRCLECGEVGKARTADRASAGFHAHWLAQHQRDAGLSLIDTIVGWFAVIVVALILIWALVPTPTPAPAVDLPSPAATPAGTQIKAELLARAEAASRADRFKLRTSPTPTTSTSQPVTTPERTSGQRARALSPLTHWQRVYWIRAQAWARSPKARAVVACESSDRVRAVSATGKYRGLWQMDAAFWSSYGGLSLAARPDLASRAGQNYVAYRGYVARGWAPWACA